MNFFDGRRVGGCHGGRNPENKAAGKEYPDEPGVVPWESVQSMEQCTAFFFTFRLFNCSG
jgi:hypothetical protein